ncbi:MAG TPA: hypothetical protein VFJ57_14590 [Solirubrobacterales bacterium]|nr:hypothetical protein [Solirubrobacterales bacterium]
MRIKTIGGLVTGLGMLAIVAWCLPASASASGTTAYLCASAAFGGEQFSDQECRFGHTGGTSGYKHIEISEATTAASATGEILGWTLKGALSGVEAVINCGSVTGVGTMSNFTNVSKEMVARGSGTITFTSCSVLKPAGKECHTSGGVTKTLEATTEGQGMAVRVAPTSGTEIASIQIEGCTVKALNLKFPLSGSLRLTPNGTTLTATHAGVTTENTLKFGGVKAGLEGSIEISNEFGTKFAPTT